MADNTDINWNKKYSSKEYLFGTEPNKFLTSQASLLVKGQRCLDVGGGEGRNSVWLAEQGLKVLSIDQSDVALGKAQALAGERGVKIETSPADLFAWDWPREVYEVLVSMHVHFPSFGRKQINKLMLEALTPGGVLIFEAFHPDQVANDTGGPSDVNYLVSAEILKTDFEGCEFIHLSEETVDLPTRPHKPAGAAVVTRAVIRKPGA
ncbi:MAG: class I SAM-dependent methyltransferase [Rhodospirillales bacterium]|nr:class I SAM-dependent methyltransferase [Rhodospirillales bacterium]